MRLKGKTAVITGGNSGIGLGIAAAFRDEGARVAILGRNRQTLDAARVSLGGDTLAVQGDVANLADIDELFRQASKALGKLDIVVANAGVGGVMPMADVDEAFFDHIMNVNFKGAYFTIQKSLPHLNDDASIILISSTAARMGAAGFSVYSASKCALNSLAKTVSAELLGRRIRVNVLTPGPVTTPLTGTLETEVRRAVERQIPIGRFGVVKEISSTAVFLASSESSFILGQDIAVDGGHSGQIYGFNSVGMKG